MTTFDLFLLHDPVRDKKPRSRLVCSGDGLSELVQETLSEIYLRRTRGEVSRYFVSQLGVSQLTEERLRRPNKHWFQLVFLQKLLKLWRDSCDKPPAEVESRKQAFFTRIEFLRVNLCNSVAVVAPKHLTLTLCKIAGAHAADGTLADCFFCITDRSRENILAFQNWVFESFAFKPRVSCNGPNEWRLAFHNKAFVRYLQVFFGFPLSSKLFTVREPYVIRAAELRYRQAFALGVLSFEAGICISREVAFCVASKQFRDDVCDILSLSEIQFKQPEKISGGYWRFWSGRLSRDSALKWLDFFEPKTEKWFKLFELANGFQGKAKTFEEAMSAFDSVFYNNSANKVCFKDVLLIISRLQQTHRYELASEIVKLNGLSSFGGKWAHSLRYYLDFLVDAKVVSVSVVDFGPKKSFGRIRRQVYSFNPNVSSWRVPYRPWLAASAT
ncbi:MAG: hypothetical protein V1817_01475 [Candidatus Micrarchaeota archaeon]